MAAAACRKALGRKVLGVVRESCLFFCSEQVVSGNGDGRGHFSLSLLNLTQAQKRRWTSREE